MGSPRGDDAGLSTADRLSHALRRGAIGAAVFGVVVAVAPVLAVVLNHSGSPARASAAPASLEAAVAPARLRVAAPSESEQGPVGAGGGSPSGATPARLGPGGMPVALPFSSPARPGPPTPEPVVSSAGTLGAGVIDLQIAIQANAHSVLPVWPVQGWVIPSCGQFGCPRPGHLHNGLDLDVPYGTPIRAVDSGRVAVLQGTFASGGYGNFICLQHRVLLATCYAHLASFADAVHLGGYVARGQIIGVVGVTGNSYGPHLHFEVRRGAATCSQCAIDPQIFMSLPLPIGNVPLTIPKAPPPVVSGGTQSESGPQPPPAPAGVVVPRAPTVVTTAPVPAGVVPGRVAPPLDTGGTLPHVSVPPTPAGAAPVVVVPPAEATPAPAPGPSAPAPEPGPAPANPPAAEPPPVAAAPSAPPAPDPGSGGAPAP